MRDLVNWIMGIAITATTLVGVFVVVFALARLVVSLTSG